MSVLKPTHSTNEIVKTLGAEPHRNRVDVEKSFEALNSWEVNGGYLMVESIGDEVYLIVASKISHYFSYFFNWWGNTKTNCLTESVILTTISDVLDSDPSANSEQMHQTQANVQRILTLVEHEGLINLPLRQKIQEIFENKLGKAQANLTQHREAERLEEGTRQADVQVLMEMRQAMDSPAVFSSQFIEPQLLNCERLQQEIVGLRSTQDQLTKDVQDRLMMSQEGRVRWKSALEGRVAAEEVYNSGEHNFSVEESLCEDIDHEGSYQLKIQKRQDKMIALDADYKCALVGQENRNGLSQLRAKYESDKKSIERSVQILFNFNQNRLMLRLAKRTLSPFIYNQHLNPIEVKLNGLLQREKTVIAALRGENEVSNKRGLAKELDGIQKQMDVLLDNAVGIIKQHEPRIEEMAAQRRLDIRNVMRIATSGESELDQFYQGIGKERPDIPRIQQKFKLRLEASQLEKDRDLGLRERSVKGLEELQADLMPEENGINQLEQERVAMLSKFVGSCMELHHNLLDENANHLKLIELYHQAHMKKSELTTLSVRKIESEILQRKLQSAIQEDNNGDVEANTANIQRLEAAMRPIQRELQGIDSEIAALTRTQTALQKKIKSYTPKISNMPRDLIQLNQDRQELEAASPNPTEYILESRLENLQTSLKFAMGQRLKNADVVAKLAQHHQNQHDHDVAISDRASLGMQKQYFIEASNELVETLGRAVSTNSSTLGSISAQQQAFSRSISDCLRL